MRRLILSSFWLSIFLTALNVFGQTESADRDELFSIAFKQMHSITYWLVHSREFLERLDPEERALLQRLNSLARILNDDPMLAHFGPLERPKLEWVQNRKEFVKEGEPERLAQTKGAQGAPIQVNRNLLNSGEVDPSYLDILQILTHELGRKVVESQEQLAHFDQMAGKINAFLQPYYQTATAEDGAKVEILSLPEEFHSLRMGPSFPTIVLVQEKGIVRHHYLDLLQVMQRLSRYTPIPDGSGNIMEDLQIRITNLGARSAGTFRVELDFNLEFSSRLVAMDPRIGLEPGAVIGDSQEMLPRANKIPLIKGEVQNMRAIAEVGRAKPEKLPQHYRAKMQEWDYQNSTLAYRVVEASVAEHDVKIRLATQVSPSTVSLRVENETGAWMVAGELIGSADGVAQYRFQIPASLRSDSLKVEAREIIVDGVHRSFLPEVVSVPVLAPEVASAGFRARLEYFDGKEWQAYTGREGVTLPEGPVRFRISAPEAPGQIRLRWNSGVQLSWFSPENVFGTYGMVHEEVIESFRAVKSEAGLFYEFESEGVLRSPYPVTTDGIGVADSGRRVLKEIAITPVSLRGQRLTYSDHMKHFYDEYLRVHASPRECSDVLGF